jgi:hypothetical protein
MRVCVCMHACMCLSVCLSVCLYVCVCVCVCVCVGVEFQIHRNGVWVSCLFVYVCVCARARVRSVSTPPTELNTHYKQRIRQLSAGGQKHTAN